MYGTKEVILLMRLQHTPFIGIARWGALESWFGKAQC